MLCTQANEPLSSSRDLCNFFFLPVWGIRYTSFIYSLLLPQQSIKRPPWYARKLLCNGNPRILFTLVLALYQEPRCEATLVLPLQLNIIIHAGAPRNLRLSINEVMLKVDWDAPDRGVTNEEIQSYVVACSFLESSKAYTLKHTVSVDVLEAFLPIGRNLSVSVYNCCIEAVFETYSSKECISTPSRLIVDDSQQQLICPNNTLIVAVAGALTSVIVILLIMLLVAVTALIYIWRKTVIQQSMKEYLKRLAVN